MMNKDDLINKIDQAAVYIPAEVMQHGTASGIPSFYSKGVLAGRKQVIEIINDNQA
jgi:hypothetical protein